MFLKKLHFNCVSAGGWPCIFVVFGCRAWPGVNTLLHSPHPAARGDLFPWHNFPSLGFQGPFHPLRECFPRTHGVSCSCLEILTIYEKKCYRLSLKWSLILISTVWHLALFYNDDSFSKHFGMSFKRYRILRRLWWAQEIEWDRVCQGLGMGSLVKGESRSTPGMSSESIILLSTKRIILTVCNYSQIIVICLFKINWLSN